MTLSAGHRRGRLQTVPLVVIGLLGLWLGTAGFHRVRHWLAATGPVSAPGPGSVPSQGPGPGPAVQSRGTPLPPHGPEAGEDSASCRQGVCLEVAEAAGELGFIADNQRYFDVLLSLRLPQLPGLGPTPPAPLLRLLPPRSRWPVCRLPQWVPRVEVEEKPRYEWDFILGDPAARHDEAARYALPFDGAAPRLLLQGIGGSFSHTGQYLNSFDFRMPVGTFVLAAREGVVARVIGDFTQGGPSPIFADQANLVTVRHADGTYGEYVHLEPGSASVREGDAVQVGQPLARSGATGFTSEPHLHFMVWKTTSDGKFETLSIRFEDDSAEGYVPRQDLWYGSASAQHSGLARSERASTGSPGP